MLDETPDTPDWWLLRLGRKLRRRQGQLEEWWRYYSGEPPLPELPSNAQQAFVDFQRKSRTNFCQLISNASVHRLFALGVTGPDGEPDDRASRWWQANRLDSRQKLVFRAAMSQATGYMMVGPHPRRVEENGRPSPLITPEHPRECIVEYDPETGEPYVGLKAIHNSIDGYGYAWVLYDDTRFPYKTKERCGTRLPWGPDSWDYVGPSDNGEPHDLGMMQLVEFARMPDLGEEPSPEFAGVMDIQDRVNMGILNRMAASRYSGFRQKWIKGHKFAKKVDPVTGLMTVEQPFVPSPSAIWASEGENAQFGQLDATDLSGFLKEHASDVRDMLILSQTPAYYYAGDLINISADTINALDILHVAKIREHIAAFGEAFEDVMSLAAAQAGVPEDYTEAEVRWANPAHISLAIKADAATKLKSIGYPLDVIAEEMGETPSRVRRITAGAASQALLAASLLPAPAPAATAGNLPDVGQAGTLNG
ncbi:phage portal protein [Streptomyces sp. A1136]|uniref:phage portal protein n=1 Tax=Streptomyces sp. A1136 TaxID=2563102 RepID=UPI00109E3D90|nr:phage portal protein [Streptomyces sp. A1136]THA56109.1 phage portal protein [Streptomyces sp. A1136]